MKEKLKELSKEKMPSFGKIMLGIAMGTIVGECAALLIALLVASLLVIFIGTGKGYFGAGLRKLAIVLAILLVARRCVP